MTHDSYHVSFSMSHIDISPDTGYFEMKQQAFGAVSRGNTYFDEEYVILP